MRRRLTHTRGSHGFRHIVFSSAGTRRMSLICLWRDGGDGLRHTGLKRRCSLPPTTSPAAFSLALETM